MTKRTIYALAVTLLISLPLVVSSQPQYGLEGDRRDECGVLNGDNSDKDDCGVCFGNNASKDACGVCDGDNSSCTDCAGIPNGTAELDECGVCNGDNSLCTDCAGTLHGSAELDECGVCNGNNSSCTDCEGTVNGDAEEDECGVCNGDNSSCTDCEDTVNGDAEEDACGVCNGPGEGPCGCPSDDTSCQIDQCPENPRNWSTETYTGLDCIANPYLNEDAVDKLDFINIGQVKLQLSTNPKVKKTHATYIWAHGEAMRALRWRIDGHPKNPGFGPKNTNACFICANIRVTGCFPAGEKILMGDGSYVPVEQVRAGDLLLNPITNEQQKVLKVVEGGEELPIIEIKYGETTLKVTQDHPVMTSEGVKLAKHLKTEKDQIMAKDGSFHQLLELSFQPIEEGQTVFNVILETKGDSIEDHMIVAEGTVVGDLALQNIMVENSK